MPDPDHDHLPSPVNTIAQDISAGTEGCKYFAPPAVIVHAAPEIREFSELIGSSPDTDHRVARGNWIALEEERV